MLFGSGCSGLFESVVVCLSIGLSNLSGLYSPIHEFGAMKLNTWLSNEASGESATQPRNTKILNFLKSAKKILRLS